MVRSFLAVIAGYISMGVLTMGAVLILAYALYGAEALEFLKQAAETREPYVGPTWVMVVEIVYSFVFAIIGGYVCARIAGRAEMKHALVMVGIMVPLSIMTIIAEQGMKPMWSIVATCVVGWIGVPLGAKLRASRANSS